MDSQKSGQNCNSPPLASSSQSSAGCGCPGDITLNITPTTGGSWLVKVDSQISIDTFRKLVAKRLRVNKERICMLYRDRHLREGSLADNGLVDGSKLTLVPSVETGLLTQRPEISVMQALEALNDSQVNDFLSGKSPLNLTMRLGDHMMLIQLQLSTVTSMVPANSLNRAKFPVITTTNPGQAYTFNNNLNDIDRVPSQTNTEPTPKPSVSQSNRQVLLSSLASALAVAKEEAVKASQTPEETSSIKSLSDLATRPTVPVPTAARIPQSRSPHSSSTLDPIAAGLTSCLCTSLSPPCSCSSNEVVPNPDEPTRLTPAKHDRPNSPILDTKALAQASKNLTQTLRQLSTEVLSSRRNANANSDPEDPRVQGAIIESMQHHGRGVYSGTFSGTLNPALQDSRGRPRRDISTIVHILNDLLCAAPPPRREAVKPDTHRDPDAIDPVLAKMVKAAKDSVGLSAEEEPMETPKSPSAPCDCTKCNNQCEASTSTASTSSSMENEVIEVMEEVPLETQEEQNTRTRDKIEQLRLVMGQRRERRRLRKQKIQPYPIPNENATQTADAVSA